jgi:hypothetical protein
MDDHSKQPSLLGDIWAYLRVRRRWWLAPIIVFLLVLGTLVVLSEAPVLMPFIYALF